VEQADLAEVVSRTERREPLSVPGHGGRALADDEERENARAPLRLARDHRLGREDMLAEAPRQLLELGLVEPFEQSDTAQNLDDLASHGRIIGGAR
jgi:hypothetical protein